MQSSSTFRRRNLPHLFLAARETLMQRFRPILGKARLTDQQWRVLRTLYDVGDVDAATLANYAQVLSPSLTRILRLLQASGLIERSPDPQDLRRQVIRLSADGRRTVKRLSPQIEAVYQELEAAIGPELMSALYRNVDTMIANIGRAGE